MSNELSGKRMAEIILHIPEAILRSVLEFSRWGESVQCPECGSSKPIYKQARKKKEGYFRCPARHRPLEKYPYSFTAFRENASDLFGGSEPSDQECLEWSEADDQYGPENDPRLMVSYRPYGPYGFYSLTGLEEISEPARPLLFNVGYRTLLAGSNVSLAPWLALICLLRDETSQMNEITRILGLTPKTVRRMRNITLDHLRWSRRDNLFILTALRVIEDELSKPSRT